MMDRTPAMDKTPAAEGRSRQTIALQIPAQTRLLPVVTRFIEESARSFGLGREESLKLCLAGEEVFLYLCRAACPEQPLEVRYEDGIYCGEAAFVFPALSVNLPNLNLASTCSWEEETGAEDMGLLLAARSVDRLRLEAQEQRRIRLGLVKEKTYPEAPREDLPPVDAASGVSCRPPDGDMLLRFAVRAAQEREDPLQPAFLAYPGKVLDMVAGGEFAAIVAVTRKDDPAGGMLYRFRSGKIAQAYGPYLFCREGADAVGRALLEDLLGRIARTGALGIAHETNLPAYLEENFEILGKIEEQRADGPSLRRRFFFRHLHEDPGDRVWSCGELSAYLRREYDRLFLGREIREVQDLGQTRSDASIFSAEIIQERSEVTLRPLWPGRDAAANLERHVRFLRAEGMRNLLFEVDLGVSWQAGLAPVLMEKGFAPCVVLPFAGQTDLVVFQYHADGS